MMFTSRQAILLTALSAIFLLGTTARSQVNELDDTTRSAIYVLRNGIAIRSDGQHHRLLRALRDLGDPGLRPLFSEMVRSDHPDLKIHGLLGLAQCHPQRMLDLVRIAAIDDPATQAQVLSAAMDQKLLTLDQCEQILRWPGLDPAIKVIVAGQLVQANQFTDIDLLQQGAQSDNLAHRGLASLLLLQLGDTQAQHTLEELLQSDAPQRNSIYLMLLETALRYDLDRCAPWAAKMSDMQRFGSKLRLMALRVAMRFGASGAISLWQQRFAAATDLADKTRLALVALGLAQWLDEQAFNSLTRDDHPLIQRFGQAGIAIATGRDITPAVIGLIERRHPLVNRWALKYAQEHAPDDDAIAILLGLILSCESPHQSQRQPDWGIASLATRALHEHNSAVAASLLGPILADPDTNTSLAQAILIGLINSTSPHADAATQGLTGFSNPQTNNLLIMLLAKHGRPLTEQQNEDFKLLVRGGGNLTAAMRLQAAWVYLKRTQQAQLALARVFSG